MYSSIEEISRKEVIRKCYWPLFKLADMGIPIGIEAPAVTLEIINKLDPDWVVSLSQYISDDKIEFIGSGYSQIIGPLVPAKVNEWNQELGLEHYK
ncbi:MAG: glycoside hydrolase, partial [Candidatus Marinimicrobia bacterium]|nr:glycoside hydrolase [Candidatus Neomarinimicrobiota bacterium]